MAKKLAMHPAGSITSIGVSDGAFVVCHGSFVKQVSVLLQLIQEGAPPRHIKALAEEISPYDTALQAMMQANEELNRLHAHQTATEANSESRPLQAKVTSSGHSKEDLTEIVADGVQKGLLKADALPLFFSICDMLR